MSSLIRSRQTFADFTSKPHFTGGGTEHESVAPLSTIREIQSATRAAQPMVHLFEESAEARGLAVKSITLTQDFRAFMERLFDTTCSIYYLAWCWDLSGQPVRVYPGTITADKDVAFALYPGESKRYMGAGSVLFPQRKISGGLAVRLQVWESDKDVRLFGDTLQAVCKEIKDSSLNSLLSVIASGVGVAGAQVALIEQAALELGTVIGTVLKANSDDFVDLYEGYFPVSGAWAAGEFTEAERSTEIVFTKITGMTEPLKAEFEKRIAVEV